MRLKKLCTARREEKEMAQAEAGGGKEKRSTARGGRERMRTGKTEIGGEKMKRTRNRHRKAEKDTAVEGEGRGKGIEEERRSEVEMETGIEKMKRIEKETGTGIETEKERGTGIEDEAEMQAERKMGIGVGMEKEKKVGPMQQHHLLGKAGINAPSRLDHCKAASSNPQKMMTVVKVSLRQDLFLYVQRNINILIPFREHLLHNATVIIGKTAIGDHDMAIRIVTMHY